MNHDKNCAWEKTTKEQCEYRETHEYCPHKEHACTCNQKTMTAPVEELVDLDKAFDDCRGISERPEPKGYFIEREVFKVVLERIIKQALISGLLVEGKRLEEAKQEIATCKERMVNWETSDSNRVVELQKEINRLKLEKHFVTNEELLDAYQASQEELASLKLKLKNAQERIKELEKV